MNKHPPAAKATPRGKAGPRWRGTPSFTTNAKTYLVDGGRRRRYAELNNRKIGVLKFPKIFTNVRHKQIKLIWAFASSRLPDDVKITDGMQATTMSDLDVEQQAFNCTVKYSALMLWKSKMPVQLST